MRLLPHASERLSRRSQSFWDEIADSLPEWDRLIEQFNAEALGSNEAGTASKATA